MTLLEPGRIGRATESLDTIVPEHAHDISRLYIWIDILSIPQRNDTLKRLPVNSLHTHARQADALVIVAPDSEHQYLRNRHRSAHLLFILPGPHLFLCLRNTRRCLCANRYHCLFGRYSVNTHRSMGGHTGIILFQCGLMLHVHHLAGSRCQCAEIPDERHMSECIVLS